MDQTRSINTQSSRLLVPLQEGVMNLRRHFPDWEEIGRLEENVTAVERRLSDVNPRLLELLGKGTSIPSDQERMRLESRLQEKYS